MKQIGFLALLALICMALGGCADGETSMAQGIGEVSENAFCEVFGGLCE